MTKSSSNNAAAAAAASAGGCNNSCKGGAKSKNAVNKNGKNAGHSKTAMQDQEDKNKKKLNSLFKSLKSGVQTGVEAAVKAGGSQEPIFFATYFLFCDVLQISTEFLYRLSCAHENNGNNGISCAPKNSNEILPRPSVSNAHTIRSVTFLVPLFFPMISCANFSIVSVHSKTMLPAATKIQRYY